MANFDAYASDIADRIAKLQEAGQADVAADIASRFQATLANHATSLAQAQTGVKAEVQAALVPLLSDVRGTLDAAANLSASASANAAARGGNSNGRASATGTESANSNANLSATTSVQAHTGASVQGGQGGIRADAETGAAIGI
jgi:hypothetical protein